MDITFKDETVRLDEVARQYDSQRDFDYHLINFSADAICPRVRDKSVLELGCSSGVMTVRLADVARNLTVVDGAAKYIEQTRLAVASRTTAMAEMDYVVSLFEEYEPSLSFEGVLLANILEHVVDPVQLLRRAQAWAAPGGEIHVVVPNGWSLHRRIGCAMGQLSAPDAVTDRDRMLGHRRNYSFASLRADVIDAGCEVIHQQGIFLKPLSNAQMEKWDIDLVRAFNTVSNQLPEWAALIYMVLTPNSMLPK